MALWYTLVLALATPARAGRLSAPQGRPIFGRTVEMDPAFSYYQGRSPRSIATELRANGYRTVRYILTADSAFQPALLEALQREKIGVWYATFCNGVYTTRDLPTGWQEWRMVTRSDLEGKPLNDGYTRLCLNNPGYRAWKKRQIAHMLTAHPFEGVDLMEPHWPEYPGPESPEYACFCPHCRAAFFQMFPQEHALPDIVHADSPESPAHNPRLWQKWLAFRTASLTDFLNDMVNGARGIRAAAPRARVCVWTLALSEADGLRRVRDDSGEDPTEIERTVKPDLYCLQTHWPDWTRADLPPDYVERYRPFVAAIRRAAPAAHVMIQADIGSQAQNRRDDRWIAAFERASKAVGAADTTLYEYFIGGYMLDSPPRLMAARRTESGIELVFNRRLDPQTALEMRHYRVSAGTISGVTADGNLVRLAWKGPERPVPLKVTATGLKVDASRLLFHDKPAPASGAQMATVER